MPVLTSTTSNPCTCCGEPIPALLECRSRGGTATLCGWSEYGSSSSPPRKYRTQTYNEDYQFCAGTEAQMCSGAGGTVSTNRNRVVNATSTYSASTCAKTVAGTRTFGGALTTCQTYGGVLNNTDSGHLADSDTSTAPVIPGFTLSSTTTTSLTYSPSPVCYTAGASWGLTLSGTRQFTLSEEDTEDDAIARLVAASAWGSWSTITDCPQCVGHYEARASGFSFAYQEQQFRVTVNDLTPLQIYQVRVRFNRRAYGGSVWELWSTTYFTATADITGTIVLSGDGFSLNVSNGHNARGFETCVADAAIYL